MRNVLITGASSGIGYEFARFFADQGDNLFLISGNKTRIEKTARELGKNSVGEIIGLAIDLSKMGAAEKVYKAINQKGKKLDLVINNAGIGYFDQLINMKLSKIEEMIQLNVTSLVQLNRLFAREMSERANPAGTIINVASVVGFIPLAYSALYSATKTLVLHFSEALSEELKEKNIKVMVLCPGSTRTSFFDRAKGNLGINRTKGIFKLNRMMSPEKVVHQAVIALERGKVIEVNGFKNRLLTCIPRILGRKTTRTLAAKIARSGFH